MTVERYHEYQYLNSLFYAYATIWRKLTYYNRYLVPM